MRIGDLIAEGETQFIAAALAFGQGTNTAWDEARWLTLAALDLPVDSPIEIESEPCNAQQIETVQNFFSRRIQERLPAAYLTGEAWLKGYAFSVDSRVIIPRSFIAELIMNHFQPWRPSNQPIDACLDLCTGSGCLAIMMADQFPLATVTATDISRDALDVAQMNSKSYGFEKRIQWLNSDVFESLTPRHQFDIIISNPPYVPERKNLDLPPEFHHEPKIALIAEDDGMAIVRRILAKADQFLAPQGLLLIEIGHERRALEQLIQQEFSGLPVTWIQTEEQSDNVFVVSKESLNQHPWRPHQ